MILKTFVQTHYLTKIGQQMMLMITIEMAVMTFLRMMTMMVIAFLILTMIVHSLRHTETGLQHLKLTMMVMVVRIQLKRILIVTTMA